MNQVLPIGNQDRRARLIRALAMIILLLGFGYLWTEYQKVGSVALMFKNPSFTEVKSDGASWPGGLKEFESTGDVTKYFNSVGVRVLETSHQRRPSAGHPPFDIQITRVSGFKIEDVIYDAELRFFNDRLMSLALRLPDTLTPEKTADLSAKWGKLRSDVTGSYFDWRSTELNGEVELWKKLYSK